MKMLKFLWVILLFLPFSMVGQSVGTISADEFIINVIPGMYTSNSVSKIHDAIYADNADNGYRATEINVYNDEFEVIATLSYNPVRYLSYQHKHRDLTISIEAPLEVVNESYGCIDWLPVSILDMKNGVLLGDAGDMPGNVFLTQTLFNDDEKFEYIVPKYRFEEEKEEIIANGGTGPAIEDVYYSQRYYTTGIEVKSQDGNVVYSLNFDEEYRYDPDLKIITWGDKTYLCIGDSKDSYSCDIYLLQRETPTSINLVKTKELGAMRLYPSVASKDTMITVDLSEKAKDKGGIIVVTDMNGKTKYSCKVEEGETSIQIPVKFLQSGLYVVSLKAENNSYEAAKLIVK